jgi:predicted transport protein
MKGITEMDAATLLFFDKNPLALPLYEAFEEKLFALFPETHKRVQKTQITFSNKHVFACISFARVKRKAELPNPYLVVTLGLSYPLESERVAIKTEPYPGRWTTHILIAESDDIDDELLSWVREAYNFSEMK